MISWSTQKKLIPNLTFNDVLDMNKKLEEKVKDQEDIIKKAKAAAKKVADAKKAKAAKLAQKQADKAKLALKKKNAAKSLIQSAMAAQKKNVAKQKTKLTEHLNNLQKNQKDVFALISDSKNSITYKQGKNWFRNLSVNFTIQV